jgi:hypothetical protein
VTHLPPSTFPKLERSADHAKIERECPCETISIKGTVQPNCWLGTNILLYYERGLEKNTNRTAVCLNRYLSYALSHVGGYGTVPYQSQTRLFRILQIRELCTIVNLTQKSASVRAVLEIWRHLEL